ncbi:hypothetical protein ACP275_08G182200 [Erythranthe tilingii]
MGSEIETVEQRLKSFTGLLQTECGILERLVYKHKNQHRRCSYFQYILKVRRDLKLLKSANLEEILDTSFIVVNGNRPKQKVQLLESLKRRKCGGGKYNFLERLLGVTRLLSQMAEPMIRAAMEISTLLARSFFMKFSLTTLAVIARIRVLVQQILFDAVLLYNTVSSLSQKEQTVKLNQEGFKVFREYYPIKEEATTMLECIWQTDKYILVEKTYKSEINNQENDREDVSLSAPKIQYENIEALLGVDESSTMADDSGSADPNNVEENVGDFGVNKDKKHVEVDLNSALASSTANIVSLEDATATNSSEAMILESDSEKLVDEKSASPSPKAAKLRNGTKNKVAFVSVKPPAPPSTANQSTFSVKNGVDNKEDDSFFNLLTGGSKKRSLF